MRVITMANSQSGLELREYLKNFVTPKSLHWGIAAQSSDPNVIQCGPMLDGLAQLETMAVNKIGVPTFTTSYVEALAWQNAGQFNVWGRNKLHTQGRDIRQFGHREWSIREFWVGQIPPEAIVAEWRLHVFDKKSIARGKKTQLELALRALAPLVRSRRNGWNLEHTTTPPQGAKFYAKAAVGAVGYLWGAVDMLQVDMTRMPQGIVLNHQRLVNNQTKNNMTPFVVLEVNQRPGMDEYTTTQYVKAVKNFALGDVESAEPVDL